MRGDLKCGACEFYRHYKRKFSYPNDDKQLEWRTCTIGSTINKNSRACECYMAASACEADPLDLGIDPLDLGTDPLEL